MPKEFSKLFATCWRNCKLRKRRSRNRTEWGAGAAARVTTAISSACNRPRRLPPPSPSSYNISNMMPDSDRRLSPDRRKVRTVRKAVFPAAGLGTRFLPATKAQPKEMLPLVDKPIIQYGVEEALAAGCDQIIIITGRGKSAIEDHFDTSYELETMLEQKGKLDLLKIVRQISDMIYVSYVRQKEALGLGHAILTARELVGDEPFAALLADDVIDAKVPVLKQLMDVFDEKQQSVIAIQPVEGAAISSYGVIKGKEVAGSGGKLYEVLDLVEKPKLADAPSNLAVIGRYILDSDGF